MSAGATMTAASSDSAKSFLLFATHRPQYAFFAGLATAIVGVSAALGGAAG
jgi:hypothetical protein